MQADQMRKGMIISKTCAVIAKGKSPQTIQPGYSLQSMRHGEPVNEDAIRAKAKQLGLNQQEQDLFVVIRRNLVHSKKVKDGQIAAFAKHVVQYCDSEADIYNALKGIEQQMAVMDHFIRYIHV